MQQRATRVLPVAAIALFALAAMGAAACNYAPSDTDCAAQHDCPTVDGSDEGNLPDGSFSDAVDAVSPEGAADVADVGVDTVTDTGPCPTGFAPGCDGGACVPLPDPSKGVFVVPPAGDGGASGGGDGGTGSCGSLANPCTTLASALAAASASGKSSVYLASGTYEGTVLLSTSVTLQGGWAAAGSGPWQPVCSNPSGAAVIKGGINLAPSAGVMVTGGSPTLDTLTVESADAAPSSVSLYGVFAVDAGTVTLSNVDVVVAAGGDGLNGTQGLMGSPAPASCTPAIVGLGVPGANAPAAQGAPAGTWSATGFIPQTGGMGMSGGNGNNGGPGAAGKCAMTSQCISTGCSNPGSAQVCGGQGSAGCGGGGGGPGTPGAGGGSSVAVFAWNTQVIATGTFQTGQGGKGGDGAGGGQPAPGTTGAQGPQAQGNSVCQSACTPKTSVTGAEGGAGTSGGNGGLGAQAGGGSGGDSYCFVQGGGGQITASPMSCTYGNPGTGGNVGGGAIHGQDGTSGVSFTAP